MIELQTTVINGRACEKAREQLTAELHRLKDGTRVSITIDEVRDDKTSAQLRYVHKIINDHLRAVLFEYGNIETDSNHLAKEWIKEYAGFGEVVGFRFKREYRERFVPWSFADKKHATKEMMSQIIDAIVRICATVDVIIEIPNEFKGEKE